MPNPTNFRANDPESLAGQAPLADLFQDLGESTRMGKLSNKQGRKNDEKHIQASSQKHLTNIDKLHSTLVSTFASISMLLSVLNSFCDW